MTTDIPRKNFESTMRVFRFHFRADGAAALNVVAGEIAGLRGTRDTVMCATPACPVPPIPGW